MSSAERADVVVIGAGAAGLLAAARAAERGRRTLLLEKNPRPGVKILMSGGTRCNLTQATDARGIVEAFGKQGKFLYPALRALPPDALVALVEGEGVPTKVEAAGPACGKVFPASDRAADVLAALRRLLDRSGASLFLGEPALAVRRRAGGELEVATPRRTIVAARVVVTSGGRSYPSSGTTGDGYGWAAELGHSLVPPRPALVPLGTEAPWVRRLRGVTLPDVAISLQGAGCRGVRPRRGGMLFTHFGLSGPAVLDLSGEASARADAALALRCDFLPELPRDELAASLRASPGARLVLRAVPQLPERLVAELLELAALPADRKLAHLDAASAARLVGVLKGAELPLSGTLGFRKAEVTAGGVPLSEVDPRTLESRLVPGLHWAGEVLDLDGPIGGYNFQAAFSTGQLAGSSV